MHPHEVSPGKPSQQQRYGPHTGQSHQDACHGCPAGRWRSEQGSKMLQDLISVPGCIMQSFCAEVALQSPTAVAAQLARGAHSLVRACFSSIGHRLEIGALLQSILHMCMSIHAWSTGLSSPLRLHYSHVHLSRQRIALC